MSSQPEIKEFIVSTVFQSNRPPRHWWGDKTPYIHHKIKRVKATDAETAESLAMVSHRDQVLSDPNHEDVTFHGCVSIQNKIIK